MFDANSRYDNLENATYTMADGRVIVYKRRRFLPRANAAPILAEVTVQEDDRLDNIAGRTLGDATQFWRIADANEAMNPFALTDEIGRKLRIGFPQV